MNTIIRLTLLEMLKKKILYLTLALTAVFLLLYGLALKYSYGYLSEEGAIIRLAVSGQLVSMGIYASSFIISFLSVFASIGAISSDIEQGTFDAILSKPIKRNSLLLGRYIGILAVLLPYLSLLFLSTVGLNVFFAGSGTSVFHAAPVMKSMLALWMLPIILTSAGVCLSTFMPTVGSGVTVVILYFCAMVGGILEQIGGFMTSPAAKAALTNIGIVTSLIMPSDIAYRKASSLLFTTASGTNLSAEGMLGATVQPSSAMLVYIFVYSLLLLIIGMRVFNRRDI